MGEQRISEWIEATKDGKHDYHERQFKQPYRSTEKFCEWLETLNLLNQNKSQKIVDLASGQGANVFHMSQKYPKSNFTGIELNQDLVNWGNEVFEEENIKNCALKQGDLFNLNEIYKNSYDGVVMYQTLCSFEDFKSPLKKLPSLIQTGLA